MSFVDTKNKMEKEIKDLEEKMQPYFQYIGVLKASELTEWDLMVLREKISGKEFAKFYDLYRTRYYKLLTYNNLCKKILDDLPDDDNEDI